MSNKRSLALTAVEELSRIKATFGDKLTKLSFQMAERRPSEDGKVCVSVEDVRDALTQLCPNLVQ